jgi:hypothetical protein
VTAKRICGHVATRAVALRGPQVPAAGLQPPVPSTRSLRGRADPSGTLLAILLTGGEAHDCPIAERLIRRVKPPKKMLGDKAYDSAELRADPASFCVPGAGLRHQGMVVSR